MEENNNYGRDYRSDNFLNQFTEDDLEKYVDRAMSNMKAQINELSDEDREKYYEAVNSMTEFGPPTIKAERKEDDNQFGEQLTDFLTKDPKMIEEDNDNINNNSSFNNIIWEVISPGIDKGLFKKREGALDYLYSIIQNCNAVEFTLKKLTITEEESEDLFKSGADFVIIPEKEIVSTDILEAFPSLFKSPLELLIEDACKNLNFFRIDINSLSLKKLNIIELTIRRNGTSFLTSPQFIVLDENGNRDYANIDNVYMPGDEANGLIVSDYINLVIKYLKQYHPNIVIETVNV